MNDVTNYLKRLQGLHANIAKEVYPNGVILTCSNCGRQEEATTEDCAYYLAHGWPKCCGHDMRTTEKEAQDGPETTIS